MRDLFKRLFAVLTVITLIAGIAGCSMAPYVSDEAEQTASRLTEQTAEQTTGRSSESTSEPTTAQTTAAPIDENGQYTHKDDVALYIYTYGHLPNNFITKKQARNLGWSAGGLDDYMDGGCIGGDKFGNYEGNLPEKDGRTYYECDIDTMHRNSRGAKRIVYSSDGLIYYSEDHYTNFVLLYDRGKAT